MTQKPNDAIWRPVVQAKPKRYLLDAYSRGRYAAQAGNNTFNPYPNDPKMAAAWLKGFKEAGGEA